MSSDAPRLKLHNTLTRKKEDFVPLDPANVRMYVCGPTVYDFAHIGNARPVIVFDVLFRLLRHLYGEKHVTYVRNITDVDDKINARALRDYPDLPLNEAIRKVTETTAAQFHRDVAALGCLAPTFEPRATEHIPGMITIIQSLLDKGFAYIARGEEGREALFDVRKMPDYGLLSGRNLAENIAGARIEVKSHKRNPEDFVLWKESAAHEPGWEATFSISDENREQLQYNSLTVDIRGRPGWHIECSAMSEALLGKTFDIHGGGLDLIFPHHENEIAQSRCAHGTHAMANYWMHNGYLQVEGRKMSKSEGNFVTIHDLLETEKFGGRKWPGEVLRLAMLMTHYREPIDFSLARLEEAENSLRRWHRAALGQRLTQGVVDKKVLELLSDDLNFGDVRVRLDALSAQAIADQEAAETLANTLAWLKLDTSVSIDNSLAKAFELQRYAGTLLPEDIQRVVQSVDATRLNANIETRLEAFATKDFAKADAIRAELLEQGIQLMDYKDPETGERRTKWEVKR